MTREKEVSQYEKMAQKAGELLSQSRETTSDVIDRVLDEAGDQLEKAGELSREEAEKTKEFLRRDLEATREDFANASSAIRKGASPSRVASGFLGFAAQAFDTLGDTFQNWAQKSQKALIYRTGEITGPGTLTCLSCGEQLKFSQAARVPPCPKCHNTQFRKSY